MSRTQPPAAGAIKGRGTGMNPANRFAGHHSIAEDDGWWRDPDDVDSILTEVRPDPTRRLISRNASPDVPFSQSINPYKGCEHGCIYCFARPTHSYLDLSPGLDFETRLFYKADAARLLDAELRKPGYVCSPIALGANTDPYQPLEKRLGITRQILQTCLAFKQPVAIITKGSLIERDLDLLGEMAAQDLVQVMVSVTSLDAELKRTLEPRAASPAARLRVIRALHAAGVPVGVLVAPVIPVITEPQLEDILAACAEAGASSAGYVLLRLPHEVKDLFRDWLEQHRPGEAAHVMSLIQQSRGGKDYDSAWGRRMRGQGQFADLLAQRFALACRRLGLNRRELKLNCRDFAPPARAGDQLSLFG